MGKEVKILPAPEDESKAEDDGSGPNLTKLIDLPMGEMEEKAAKMAQKKVRETREG